MIWVWLWKGWLATLRLILPPPPATLGHRVIDINAPCPGCGHQNGEIRSVLDPVKRVGSVVRHDCHVCHGHWFEEAVVKDNATVFIPSEVQFG